jgi:glycerol kinase
MKYIMAIDQGTTGSRAIVYDKQARKIASAYQEFPQYFPRPGWVEHRPLEIWGSVYSCIQKVMQKIPDRSIAAIGITNQRETTVMWDKKTGQPLYNAIVWQCRRTASRCDVLKKQRGKTEFFRKRTGLPIDAYFSATKIEWLLKNIPRTAAAARKGNACFGTTDSWVLWKLTGGSAHATDYSNASRTMLLNIQSLKWDEDLLHEFRIPPAILPRVLRSSGVFGTTVRVGKLPAGIPVAGIAGDQQAALFGQGCFDPGNIKNTYGTGAFLLLNVGRKRPSSRHGLITTGGCGPAGEPVFVLEGAVFVAGAAIQWLRDQVKILNSAKESEAMARAVDDNAGVYFVPALVGLGAPYWDQNARGCISGITRGTNRNHLVRAALEAMCYQTRDVVEAMQKDSALPLKDLKVDGGAVANNFLCQFQADVLGQKVIRPQVIETTSLGAAYLAGLAVGYWKDSGEIRKCWRSDRVFTPRMTPAAAHVLYAGWKKAVTRTLTDGSQ